MNLISKKTAALAFGVTLVTGVFIGQALAYQEHMHAAMDDLRAARGELESAESDKGGHRVEAIRLVDQAMDETRAGMEFSHDRDHY